jgi:protein phosphatase methylesterase 1
VLSLDARGHGETVVRSPSGGTDDLLDLTLDTLADDLVRVVELAKRKLGLGSLPGLILVGHSLGGAVVTHVAKSGRLGASVLGYAVLDVVEGGQGQRV